MSDDEEIKEGFLRRIFGNLGVPDIPEVMVNGILMYLGYDRFGNIARKMIPKSDEELTPEDERNVLLARLIGLCWGPVALKLIASPGGGEGFQLTFLGTGIKLPVNVQMAGLTMLTTLGVASIPWEDLGEVMKKQYDRLNEGLTYFNNMMGGPITPEERLEVDQKWGMWLDETNTAAKDQYWLDFISLYERLQAKYTWLGRKPGEGGAR